MPGSFCQGGVGVYCHGQSCRFVMDSRLFFETEVSLPCRKKTPKKTATTQGLFWSSLLGDLGLKWALNASVRFMFQVIEAAQRWEVNGLCLSGMKRKSRREMINTAIPLISNVVKVFKNFVVQFEVKFLSFFSKIWPFFPPYLQPFLKKYSEKVRIPQNSVSIEWRPKTKSL